MRSSVRTKFLLLIVTLLAAIFTSITLFQIQQRTVEMRARLFKSSQVFATLATNPIGNVFAVYKDSGTLRIDQEVNRFADLDDNITNIAVVDINATVHYAQHSDAVPDVSADEAASFEPVFRNDTNGVLATVVYPFFEASGAHRYSVVYSVSSDTVEEAIRDEVVSVLTVGMVSLLATLVMTYFLIDIFIIRPLKQVSEQAAVISAGNLEQQITVKGRDEIAGLGSAVNKMAESLKENIAQLKEVDKVKSEFMMITSHNLRTPLAIIDGYLDSSRLLIDDPEKLSEALTRIGSSVKRLEVFAEDILMISQMELGNADLRLDDVGAGQFIEQLAKDFMPTATFKQLEFDVHIDDGDAMLKINKPYIRSAIWNVLDNAVKFTPAGGRITLDARQTEGSMVIAISDTGIGISPDELKKLFTKFHRGTSTLNYDFEGTGIGLYASKMMIEKHGGTISAASEQDKGSTFTIKLPV